MTNFRSFTSDKKAIAKSDIYITEDDFYKCTVGLLKLKGYVTFVETVPVSYKKDMPVERHTYRIIPPFKTINRHLEPGNSLYFKALTTIKETIVGAKSLGQFTVLLLKR